MIEQAPCTGPDDAIGRNAVSELEAPHRLGDLLVECRSRGRRSVRILRRHVEPLSEQRHLLNQGMLDLLDRALDKAADELPEDDFDGVLAQVMGYRQRLVL